MGILHLLPFLKQYAVPRSLREFSGQTIGVDAMCWMHKGAFACAKDLLRGADSDLFIRFFLKMCEVMKYYQIKPLIVFDGAKMPAKAVEDARRTEVREVARKEAMDLLKRREDGERIDDRALELKCQLAIRVTSVMISRLQTALIELGIQFMVAPFEADAQLAYMCRLGLIQAAISEDSDLLAYGCPNTIFKMDKFGDGQNIRLPLLQPRPLGVVNVDLDSVEVDDTVQDLEGDSVDEDVALEEEPHDDSLDGVEPHGGRDSSHENGIGAKENAVANAEAKSKARSVGGRRGKGATKKCPKIKAKGVDMAMLDQWTPERFIEFCVLCGTDYKEHDVRVKGLGPVNAFKMLCRFQSVSKMFAWMRLDKTWKSRFPCDEATHENRFRSVVAVFFHHNVFDPTLGCCTSIAHAFPGSRRSLPGIDLRALCGTTLAASQAKAVARGEVDPRTMEPRERVPLMPAERRVLDYCLQSFRALTHRHESEQQRLQEAARLNAAADARREELAAAHLRTSSISSPADASIDVVADLQSTRSAMSRASRADASATGHFPSEVQQLSHAEDEDDDDDEPPPKPTILLSDLKVILAIWDDVQAQQAGGDQTALQPAKVDSQQRGTHTPNRTVPASSVTGASATPPPVVASKTNPFARKRLSTTMSNACAPAAEGVSRCLVVEKRMRADDRPVQSRPLAPCSAPTPQQRNLVAPDYHPRGGYAAETAARAVLMQRGIMEVEPLAPGKDRGKLTSFFDLKASPKPAIQPKEQPAAAKKLADWTARPWDEKVVDDKPYHLGLNPLALKSARGNVFGRSR